MTQANQQLLFTVGEVIACLKDKPGALLPILHEIQRQLGYIPAESIPLIAQALHLSQAEVHGVISFYHQFRSSPPGKHTIEICRAEACQSMGSRQLEAYAQEQLSVSFHRTTTDNCITLEPVYCLGNCACAPSLRVNDEIIGRVSQDKFDRIIDALRSQTLEVK